ncbi:MAG: hypothetical protein HXX15_12620 [Rhodopseudomonas sp.]|uniref:hypothetical protein n=1 Tax=Rhodopseudomonas sp. TaxID=1078 RepID=UPI001812F166|nr:hypothetical protein [Rhodopseudomonas sp.]NVN86918.1 hypothetical protein [Rhodopseudomonas sp.]
MRRVVVIAVAGLGLAGCSSMDVFKSAPPPVTVQLDSVPPGANASTSTGPGCKTPCSISVPPDNFSVTYTLNRYQTMTVPVQVVTKPGDIFTSPTTTVDPNPVVAQLQPVAPVRKRPVATIRKPKKPKPAAVAPDAAPAASSPFPAPSAAPAR